MLINSEDFLRQKSEFVTLEESKELISKLHDSLCSSENGVGLAAPQIGELKRVCIVKTYNKIVDLVNPVIIKLEKPFLFKGEGCLSFPGLWINTIRYEKVVVKDDLNGLVEFNNFASVVAQHEIQHLDGILYIDNRVPESYEPCFCGSKEKFKFCCRGMIL